MTQRCIFKSKLLSTFSGLCSMFSVLKLVLKCNLKAGCCFCFASLWEPLMQTAPRRHKERRLRALGRDVCGSICSSHTLRDAEIESSYWTNKEGGTEEHTRTRTHTYREKPKKQCGSRSVFVNTFHHRETLNQQRIPWVCLSKDLTKMERVINMSNMTRVALSALKASVQWKGAWTQHTWRTRTKKKTKKEKKSLQGGQRKCVDPDTIRYIHCLIYPAHGGGRESPHVCLVFFYVQVGC